MIGTVRIESFFAAMCFTGCRSDFEVASSTRRREEDTRPHSARTGSRVDFEQPRNPACRKPVHTRTFIDGSACATADLAPSRLRYASMRVKAALELSHFRLHDIGADDARNESCNRIRPQSRFNCEFAGSGDTAQTCRSSGELTLVSARWGSVTMRWVSTASTRARMLRSPPATRSSATPANEVR